MTLRHLTVTLSDIVRVVVAVVYAVTVPLILLGAVAAVLSAPH